jgi:hypothetical protein
MTSLSFVNRGRELRAGQVFLNPVLGRIVLAGFRFDT